MASIFSFTEATATITPQLLVNRDQLERNIDQALVISNGPDRLWPHIKTHKSKDIVRLMVGKGIKKFKCATISECETAAEGGAKIILLAYPMVGPTITRFLDIMEAFPDIKFLGLLDDKPQLQRLQEEASLRNITANIMIDVNVGLNRTGVSPTDVVAFYNIASELSCIHVSGIHCYDGQRHESDVNVRAQETEKTYLEIQEIIKKISCEYLIMGGSPSFPCYAKHPDVFLSPGTIFINDAGYEASYPDLNFPPAAAILTRVISTPHTGWFTLDLGYKGIASDPPGQKGFLVDVPHAKPLFQNEEHWVWAMQEGYEAESPHVGDELFVIPTHICPTSALYPFFLVLHHGHMVARWDITARNRKITY